MPQTLEEKRAKKAAQNREYRARKKAQAQRAEGEARALSVVPDDPTPEQVDEATARIEEPRRGRRPAVTTEAGAVEMMLAQVAVLHNALSTPPGSPEGYKDVAKPARKIVETCLKLAKGDIPTG